MLDRDQLRIRVKAAREVAGLTRQELGERMKQDGFGKEDPAALERKVTSAQTARELPLTPGRIESLARHTGFPKEWFTEPSVERLFVGSAAEDPLAKRHLEDLEQRVIELWREVRGGTAEDLEADLERAAREVESEAAGRQAGSTDPHNATQGHASANE